MKLSVSKVFSFESSHQLPRHPGKCANLHGHSWKLVVEVKGPIDPETGFVMDYAILKGIVQPIVDKLDHKHLGAFWPTTTLAHNDSVLPEDFYPSSENLVVWLADVLTGMHGLKWSKIELEETDTSRCTLLYEDYVEDRKL